MIYQTGYYYDSLNSFYYIKCIDEGRYYYDVIGIDWDSKPFYYNDLNEEFKYFNPLHKNLIPISVEVYNDAFSNRKSNSKLAKIATSIKIPEKVKTYKMVEPEELLELIRTSYLYYAKHSPHESIRDSYRKLYNEQTDFQILNKYSDV